MKKLIPITGTLAIGDELVDKNGNRRTIIEQNGDYFRLTHKNTKHPGSWWHIDSLMGTEDRVYIEIHK